jgi:hypothetical protein
MAYVYSTLSCDQGYAIYDKGADGTPILNRVIHINGKANITNKVLQTPRGVVTEVSDADLETLNSNYHFNEHVKLGFITFEAKQFDADQVAKDMTKQDKSAPKTKDELENDQVSVMEGKKPRKSKE